MRHLRFRTVFALTALVVAPAFAMAQEPGERPATHTVKKGDTLWDLAKQYLGDPFQWPQIFRLNSELIKDPHWIYPGQILKLPGGAAAPAGAAPEAGGAPATQGARPSRTHSMTVFDPRTHKADPGVRQSLIAPAPRTAVRAGDFEAAPFMWAEGGPTNTGRVDGTAEALASGIDPALRPIQQMEDVFVRMPRGVDARPGAQLLVYRLADVFVGKGQVVVPTGIVRVVASLDGDRARATVVQKFEEVHIGDGLMPLDTLAMPDNVFPSRVEFGLATRIRWVYADPRLPARGTPLILDAGAAQGLVPGDQVTIRTAAGATPGTTGLPESDVAVAQVVRVTQWGASAMLIDVRAAGTQAGAQAVVTAKMP
jgi:LysM repeat protein